MTSDLDPPIQFITLCFRMKDQPARSPHCVQSTRGDLAMVKIRGTQSTMEIAHQGAHICSWQVHGEEPVLFLSPNSQFTKKKAIRGGVPVIFPWFGRKAGDSGAAQHGFARTAPWKLSRSESNVNGSAIAEFRLCDSESSLAVWPYSFAARLVAEAERELRITLEITNTDSKPFSFGAGLHSYFCVSDIHRIRILGLGNTKYIDQLTDNEIKTQSDEAITFDSEVDRIFTDTTAACAIDDPGWNRRIVIAKSGSNSTVVWNPWTQKARSMADLGETAWTGMVCVETTNAGPDTVTLQPGATHRLAAVISTEAGVS